MLEKCPYSDIIPFLSEHINPSDQILLLGCSTDFPYQLLKGGFGLKKTGFVMVIDESQEALNEVMELVSKDESLEEFLRAGKIQFQRVDYGNMADVCKQSCVDAIVDYGAIDTVLKPSNKLLLTILNIPLLLLHLLLLLLLHSFSHPFLLFILLLSYPIGSKEGSSRAVKCVQHLQDAVRLGNILISLSKLENDVFKVPFEAIGGWVQELDGEPGKSYPSSSSSLRKKSNYGSFLGEISAWYRGKTNIEASKSNFQQLGLKMFVYTNTDNC